MLKRDDRTKEQWDNMFKIFIQPNPFITDWEVGFCRDIFNQDKHWSEKQAQIFDGIIQKRIKPYVQMVKKRKNGYCKPTTLRVARYK